MHNKSLFLIFLIPGVNQVIIKEYIESARVPGSWATQVEVVAAASAFEIPITTTVLIRSHKSTHER